MRKRIRLNEGQLHNVIKESVYQILNEMMAVYAGQQKHDEKPKAKLMAAASGAIPPDGDDDDTNKNHNKKYNNSSTWSNRIYNNKNRSYK